MRPRGLRTFALGAILPLLTGCNLALLPEDYMNSMGEQAFVDATSQYREITGTPEAQMVRRVGERIAQASGKDYAWEFKLLDAPKDVNAFCLPGGKIAVYSGLLPVTQNENALAVVIGHEVAHATLQHGNKRMTQGMGLDLAMGVAESALSGWGNVSSDNRALVMEALGAGAQFGLVLPYGRGHESEADEVGVRYVVRAGYDPWEAPKLWERMGQLGGENPPEWMSTHPNPETRAAALREMIPRILAEEGGAKGGKK